MEHNYKENEALLEEFNEQCRVEEQTGSQRCPLQRALIIGTVVAILSALCSALVASLITARLLRAQTECATNFTVSKIYSPAQTAYKYSETPTIFDDKLYPNLYIGEPRPEIDEAWSRLLTNPYFRVTESEYARLNLNRSTLGLSGSKDKVISFSAYHELHCLKTLYRWIHHEHYFPGLGKEDDEFNFQRWHAEHCLSYLRQQTMCTASLSPITLEWFEATPGQPRPRPNTHTPRQCIDWDSLDSWSAKRKVDLYDLDSLANMPGRGW